MDMELKDFQMEMFMLDIIAEESQMGKVNIIGKMDQNIQAILQMV